MPGLRVVIDDREKFVRPFAQVKFAGEKDKLKCERLTVGDMAIAEEKDKILAIFERKTLKDYSAGIKDGRYENVSELIKLRNDTGCLVVFIIEHKVSYPSLVKKHGGIPFKNILASIDLLTFRSGIHVIWTKNPEHTAERLHDFYMRYVKIETDQIRGRVSASLRHVPPAAKNESSVSTIVETKTTIPNSTQNLITEIKLEKPDKNIVAGSVEENKVETPTRITAPIDKDDDRLIKEMWHTVAGGLSYNVAGIISTKFTVIELVNTVTQIELKKLTYESGVKFSTKIVKTLVSIKNRDKEVIQKLICGIPKIGKATTRENH